MMSANLRDLGRLAAWPVGRLAGLLLLGALALMGKRCTPQPVVGDFPVLEWSSRDPVLASLPLPFVFGLVVPSDLPRMRARRVKHRELPRALRQYRAPAWFPARHSPRRYGLPRQRWQESVPIARVLGGPLAIEHQRRESAAFQWVMSARPRGQNPGTRETAQARRLFARRCQCVGRAPACVRAKTPCCHRKALLMLRRCRSSGFPVRALGVRVSQGTEDFDDHGPRPQVARCRYSSPLWEVYWWGR